MAYNSLQQLRTNIEAIRIALGFQPGNKLDEAQLSTLHGYKYLYNSGAPNTDNPRVAAR